MLARKMTIKKNGALIFGVRMAHLLSFFVKKISDLVASVIPVLSLSVNPLRIHAELRPPLAPPWQGGDIECVIE